MTVQTITPASPALDKAHQDLKNACRQFEAYFTDMMLKEMRKTVPQDTLLGDSDNQQQIFQDMMDQTLADQMSQRSNLGLGQMLYNELAPTLAPPAPNNGGVRQGSVVPLRLPIIGAGGDPGTKATSENGR